MRGALQVGEILCGRYRLLKALGEGGMGAVFLAERIKLGKRVVIKTLHEEFGHDPTFRARFKREARVTSKIEHDNIVNVLDVDEHEGFLFYVMEYLDGEDLSQTLEREKRLAWPRARWIGVQLCGALAAAHRKKIVHRDLKPSNCFLVRRDVRPDEGEVGDFVKIIDFGIAQLLDTSSRKTGSGSSNDRAKLTLAGEVFGTLLYMSPEHYAGQPTDRRTDVYAVGCILYQMLTGEVPIAEGPILSLRLANEHPAPPSQRAPDAGIPGDIDHLVLKALAKRPEDRFPEMDTLLAALERASDGLTRRASPQRASRQRSPVDSSARTLVRRPDERYQSADTVAAALRASDAAGVRHPATAALARLALAACGLAAVVGLAVFLSMRSGASEDLPDQPAAPVAVTQPVVAVPPAPVPAVEPVPEATIESAPPAPPPPEPEPTRTKPSGAKLRSRTAAKTGPIAAVGDAEIKSAEASVRYALQECEELGFPGTTYKVDVEINVNGRVTSATAHKPARGSALGNCIEKAAARATFPALTAPQRVTLALRLYIL